MIIKMGSKASTNKISLFYIVAGSFQEWSWVVSVVGLLDGENFSSSVVFESVVEY